MEWSKRKENESFMHAFDFKEILNMWLIGILFHKPHTHFTESKNQYPIAQWPILTPVGTLSWTQWHLTSPSVAASKVPLVAP